MTGIALGTTVAPLSNKHGPNGEEEIEISSEMKHDTNNLQKHLLNKNIRYVRHHSFST